jgi:hypothetical protein
MLKAEGLKEQTKKRFIDDAILASLKDGNPAGLILVLDPTTATILTNCMSLSELILAGVTAVESIEKVRKPFPTFRAVYFLTPNRENVDYLQADYEPKKLYRSQYVFFSRPLAEPDFQYLTTKPFSKKLGGLKEFNLDMFPIADNLFLSPHETSLELQAGSVVSAIASLQDVASIELFKPNGVPFKESAQLFSVLSSKLKALYPYLNSTGKGVALKVFVFERGMDLVAPFMHDLHYEPMLADLLDGQVGLPGDATRSKLSSPEFFIDSSDRIYRKYRYEFIKDLMAGVPKDFDTFMKGNATAKAQKRGDGEMGITEMQNVVRGIGEYNDMVTAFKMHVKCSKMVMDSINKGSVREVTDVEMTVATGVSDQGEILSANKRMAAAKKYLSGPGGSEEGKLRVALVASGSIGKADPSIGEALGPAQKRALAKHSTLTQGFGHFIPDSQTSDYSKEVKTLYDVSESHLERFISRAEFVVGRAITQGKSDQLDTLRIDEGSSTPKKGLGTQVNTLFKGRLNPATPESSNNVILAYFVGGASYVEVCGLARACRKAKGGARLIVGSTDFLSPKQFIKRLF